MASPVSQTMYDFKRFAINCMVYILRRTETLAPSKFYIGVAIAEN